MISHAIFTISVTLTHEILCCCSPKPLACFPPHWESLRGLRIRATILRAAWLLGCPPVMGYYGVKTKLVQAAKECVNKSINVRAAARTDSLNMTSRLERLRYFAVSTQKTRLVNARLGKMCQVESTKAEMYKYQGVLHFFCNYEVVFKEQNVVGFRTW